MNEIIFCIPHLTKFEKHNFFNYRDAEGNAEFIDFNFIYNKLYYGVEIVLPNGKRYGKSANNKSIPVVINFTYKNNKHVLIMTVEKDYSIITLR